MGQSCAKQKPYRSPTKQPMPTPERKLSNKHSPQLHSVPHFEIESTNKPSPILNSPPKFSPIFIMSELQISDDPAPPHTPPQTLSKHLKNPCFITPEDINSVYKITNNILGMGSFGTVKEAYLLANQQKTFAVKCIPKQPTQPNESHLASVHREIRIFRQLDHPNIVRLIETYEDRDFFYLIMEKCSGGELLERLLQLKRMPESKASELISSILCALKYLHSLGIVHRDLKVENFMFSSEDTVKMIDFGLSKQVFGEIWQSPGKKSLRMGGIVGTAKYMAPEVFCGSYTSQCDIYSVGVILYCVLCGTFPPQQTTSTIATPNSPSNSAALQNTVTITKTTTSLLFPDDITMSKQARDLIHSMLDPNPDKRISIDRALTHPWFQLQQLPIVPSKVFPEFKHINALKSYHRKLSLFGKFINYLAQKVLSFDESILSNLSRVFNSIDSKKDGVIRSDALIKSMKSTGFSDTKLEVEEIIAGLQRIPPMQYEAGMEFPQIGSNIFQREEELGISFSAFVQANLDRSIVFSEENLEKIFAYLDCSSKRWIGKQDLQTYFMREGFRPEHSDLIIESIFTEVCGTNQQHERSSSSSNSSGVNINNKDTIQHMKESKKQNDPVYFDFEFNKENHQSKKIFLSDFIKLSSPLIPTRSSSFANDQFLVASTSITSSSSHASQLISPAKSSSSGAAHRLILLKQSFSNTYK